AAAERARLQQARRERLQLDRARAGAARLRRRHAAVRRRLDQHVRGRDDARRGRPRLPVSPGRGCMRRRRPRDARDGGGGAAATLRERRLDRPGGRAARSEAGRSRPVIFPERVTLVEVAPRDGLQSLPTLYPTDLKVELVELLAATGVPKIEVTAFVRPEV